MNIEISVYQHADDWAWKVFGASELSDLLDYFGVNDGFPTRDDAIADAKRQIADIRAATWTVDGQEQQPETETLDALRACALAVGLESLDDQLPPMEAVKPILREIAVRFGPPRPEVVP